jgi:hypothetical protein
MGSWSATMDFVLAILRKPWCLLGVINILTSSSAWHIIMGLNMRRKDKITIASGLSLGIFAGACSIVRTIELQSLSSMENYVYEYDITQELHMRHILTSYIHFQYSQHVIMVLIRSLLNHRLRLNPRPPTTLRSHRIWLPR